MKNRLEGEVWDVEVERGGNLNWRVIVGRGKREVKEEWERCRGWWMKEGFLGVSDASMMSSRVGIGAVLRLYGLRYGEWRESRGYGLTVGDGEMAGLAKLLEVVREYEGEARVLRVGVDNVGVLRRLGKGRGFCGKWEQKVREVGVELLEKGWAIEWRWVPGHVGVRENEEADRLAKDGVFMEEEEENKVVNWGEWERRRNRRVERYWKEYWKGREKGKVYFGSGKGGKGHGGRRRDSIFLFWMRCGQGRMRGTRYGWGNVLCECGEREDRDHVLLKCGRWVEERRVIWDACSESGREGYLVDVRWLLFEDKGIEAVRKFGAETGWLEKRWRERREWNKLRVEEWGWRWVEGRRGLVGERAKDKRDRDLRLGRERMRRKRLLLKSKGEEGGGRCREGTPLQVFHL